MPTTDLLQSPVIFDCLLVKLLAGVAVHVRAVVEDLSGRAQVGLVAVEILASLHGIIRGNVAGVVRKITSIELRLVLLELRRPSGDLLPLPC